MIVTIVNETPLDAAGLVAENLALLRARGGRKVVLLDASAHQACRHWGSARLQARLRPVVAVRELRGGGVPEALDGLHSRFHDILIDAAGCDGAQWRAALIAAQAALVPLAPEQADVDARYQLIARLNAARMFNPGLRILFVATGMERDPAPSQLCALRGYAAQVMSAALARTVIHLPALQWGADAPGRCASDLGDSTGAAEMAALYREVYGAPAPRPQAALAQ